MKYTCILNTNISSSATHIILQFDKTILKKEIVPQNQTDVIARFSDRQLLTIVPSRCRLLWGNSHITLCIEL